MTELLQQTATRPDYLEGNPDLRDWLQILEQAGKLRVVEGADWNLEIGALVEMVCLNAAEPPALLFDQIKDYPAGWRILNNAVPTIGLAARVTVIPNCRSQPLDPRLPPEKRASRDYTTSRVVIDATRPFHWRDQFPKVVGTSAELQAKMRAKWGEEFFE